MICVVFFLFVFGLHCFLFGCVWFVLFSFCFVCVWFVLFSICFLHVWFVCFSVCFVCVLYCFLCAFSRRFCYSTLRSSVILLLPPFFTLSICDVFISFFFLLIFFSFFPLFVFSFWFCSIYFSPRFFALFSYILYSLLFPSFSQVVSFLFVLPSIFSTFRLFVCLIFCSSVIILCFSYLFLLSLRSDFFPVSQWSIFANLALSFLHRLHSFFQFPLFFLLLCFSFSYFFILPSLITFFLHFSYSSLIPQKLCSVCPSSPILFIIFISLQLLLCLPWVLCW